MDRVNSNAHPDIIQDVLQDIEEDRDSRFFVRYAFDGKKLIPLTDEDDGDEDASSVASGESYTPKGPPPGSRRQSSATTPKSAALSPRVRSLDSGSKRRQSESLRVKALKSGLAEEATPEKGNTPKAPKQLGK